MVKLKIVRMSYIFFQISIVQKLFLAFCSQINTMIEYRILYTVYSESHCNNILRHINLFCTPDSGKFCQSNSNPDYACKAILAKYML
jgi:hypothetical protein